jgi:hypothetical protein
MKQHILAGVAFALIVFLGSTTQLGAESDDGARQPMMDAARQELQTLAAHEVPSESLGEWGDVIDSSLFLAFRRTELWRGPLRALVTDNPAIEALIYPEGTFVISSGLLDYIDTTLFEAATDSPRRMRNLTKERESMILPFIAVEAAHFALDHQFTNWKRNVGSAETYTAATKPSAAETLEADGIAAILLESAGTDPATYRSWIASLDATAKSGKGDFSAYLAGLPQASERIATLDAVSESIPDAEAEFANILECIRSGTGFSDAADGIATLKGIYPVSPWIARLEAIVLHRAWLATVPPAEQYLRTFFPCADERDPARAGFIELLRKDAGGKPALAKGVPGNQNAYAKALEAYAKIPEAWRDTGLTSTWATLLVRSGSEADRKLAVLTAKSAAAEEEGSEAITARANCAAVLYLSGADTARAKAMMNALLNKTTIVKTSRDSVDAGYPGDERDLLVNTALIFRATGETKKSVSVRATLDPLVVETPATIALRGVRAGDNTDTLVAKWGKPAEIAYNYYTENWLYPSYGASVLVEPGANGGTEKTIRLIRFGQGSTLSPGGDIRVGDAQSDLEGYFGKPAYRSGDCDVYLKDGNRVSAFCLAGKIRSLNCSY